MPLLTAAEHAAVARALELAERGAGTVLPNPVVGCVLLSPDGTTVGEGFHQQAGGPHAEVVALRTAGEAARGSTAVVTLEPCNHTGRTPPCTQALIAAGVSKVVVAVRDPWPTAAGGIEVLAAAGVQVLDLSGTDSAAEDVNRVWLTATRRRRPFVTFKAGMTIDARVAAADGSSQWITSVESTTTRSGCRPVSRPAPSRTVSSGSSARTVPTPTIMVLSVDKVATK